MSNENKKRINSKVAKEPLLAEQPTDLLHTRRNLLVTSFIVLFACISGLSINLKALENYISGEASIIHIFLATSIITLYLLVSFFMKYRDYFDSQVLLTTRLISLDENLTYAGGNDDLKPRYVNPKYSSIYNWWLRAPVVINYRLKALDEKIESLTNFSEKGNGDINMVLNKIQEALSKYGPENELLKSLGVFEDGFRNHLYNQKCRVIVLEGLLPFIAGLSALLVLIGQIIIEVLHC